MLATSSSTEVMGADSNNKVLNEREEPGGRAVERLSGNTLIFLQKPSRAVEWPRVVWPVYNGVFGSYRVRLWVVL